MSTLERQVARAGRRLNGNLFLERLCTGVLAAAGLWTLTLLVERAFVLGIPINATIWAAGLRTGSRRPEAPPPTRNSEEPFSCRTTRSDIRTLLRCGV